MLVRSWLDALKSRFTRQPTRRERRAAGLARPLHVESLEDRRLMAFDPVATYAAGDYPNSVVAADFNGDGTLDLATANYSSSNVSVLLGNSDGTFQPALNSPTGASPQSLAVGDFNEDGKLDLATANASEVSVLLGNGNGTFQGPTSVGSGSSVAVGDFNGDGKLDLAVGGHSSWYSPPWWGYYGGGGGYWVNQANVSVLMGNGDGSFGTPASQNLWWSSYSYWYGPSTTPVAFAVADFNSDLKDDLAAVTADFNTVGVLLGTGTGLGAPAYFTTGWYPRAVTAGDFTGDGKLDLATVGNTVDILPGNGDGTFIGVAPVNVDPVAVAPGDFNGDGHLDLVTADVSTVSVQLGTSAGALTPPLVFAAGSGPIAVAVGDFNGDGRPDVAAANANSGGVSVLLNDGDWPDPDAPSISITDVTVTEGNTGSVTATFNVNLSAAYGQTVTIDYATASGSAVAGSDFVATNGTLTFTPGQPTSQQITVQVSDDLVTEYDEAFYVQLTSPMNAFVADSQGVGTILDNEPRVSIDYGPVYVTEGNTGTTNAKFTVRLAAPYALPVKVNLSVVEGDTDFYIGSYYYGYYSYPPAALNTDFEGGSQTITFNPGELTKEITVPVKGDRVGEVDEYFFVNLNSTDYGMIVSPQAVGIIDDDEPRASISYAGTVGEGSGKMTFTISLSNSSPDIVEVTYATADYGSATAGSDYVAKVGTATFNPGELTKDITVDIIDDRLGEYDEYLYVNLTGATGAMLEYQTSGYGYIQDNEPRLSINSVSITEGGSGTKLMTFTVTLSAAYDQAVTVKYATQNGSAVAGSDYLAASGSLTFAIGQTTKTFTVAIKGDKSKEYDEYFYVELSGASSNALLYNSVGSGTILNDDGGKGPRR